jgi:hypothetical protein
MSPGTISLAEIAGRVSMLEVACNRCPRRGRLSIGRRLEEHGDIPGPELLERLSADCPRR